MQTRTKIYIVLGLAAIVAFTLLGSWLWSRHRLSKLERAVEEHKQIAQQHEQVASTKEIEAAQYKQKLEYLESQLAEIRDLADKQDEELQNLTSNTRSARGDVERARRTRTALATAAELCQKLAQVGHPCD